MLQHTDVLLNGAASIAQKLICALVGEYWFLDFDATTDANSSINGQYRLVSKTEAPILLSITCKGTEMSITVQTLQHEGQSPSKAELLEMHLWLETIIEMIEQLKAQTNSN